MPSPPGANPFVGDGGRDGGQRDDRAAGGICAWTADPAGKDQGGAGAVKIGEWLVHVLSWAP